MNKLFWIDMEMTGLDVEKEVIIEVGAVITDLQFNELQNYHAVVRQPQQYLDRMDDWNRKHHSESGLLQLVPSGRSPDVVEKDLLELLDQYFTDERAVIAGNSIGQDRLFINKYFSRFAERLHYRMLDVTSWKIIFNNVFKYTYPKQTPHRAIEDIRESINELKSYMSFIKV